MSGPLSAPYIKYSSLMRSLHGDPSTKSIKLSSKNCPVGLTLNSVPLLLAPPALQTPYSFPPTSIVDKGSLPPPEVVPNTSTVFGAGGCPGNDRGGGPLNVNGTFIMAGPDFILMELEFRSKPVNDWYTDSPLLYNAAGRSYTDSLLIPPMSAL